MLVLACPQLPEHPLLFLSPGLTPAKSALAPRLVQNGKTMCSKPPLGLRG